MKLGATGVLALAGLAVAGIVGWRVYRTAGNVGQAVADVVTRDLNPASADNVVNRAVQALGESITGDPAFTLGGTLYDLTHADKTDPTRNTALAAINPADSGNLVNRAVTAAGKAATGDPSFSLGSWLYDKLH